MFCGFECRGLKEDRCLFHALLVPPLLFLGLVLVDESRESSLMLRGVEVIDSLRVIESKRCRHNRTITVWPISPSHLVSISSRVILRTNNQTPTLLRTPINSLDDINQLLLILKHPIQFVVVSRSEITHHVLVAEEEHDGHGIVEFVHLVEIGDLVEVADVDDGEVFDAVGDAVQDFVLAHAVFVPVAAEADHD